MLQHLAEHNEALVHAYKVDFDWMAESQQGDKMKRRERRSRWYRYE